MVTRLVDRAKTRAGRLLCSSFMRSPTANFGVAILAVALTATIQASFLRDLGTPSAYLAFYPCVTIAAILGGVRAGALTAVLAVLIDSFWIAPFVDAADWIRLATFLLSCALIVNVVEALHRARARAEENAGQLQLLRLSEERLRLFFDHVPAAVAVFDREMRCVAASRRWLCDYGLAGRELIGLSYYEAFPEIPERWRETLRHALDGGTLRGEEELFQQADGSWQRLRWETLPYRDAAGAVAGIVIFSEDITQRKEAEHALYESERRLRAIFDATTDAIVTVSEHGLIDSVNASASRLFGYDAHQMIGRNVSMLMPEPHRSQHDSYIQNYIRTGEAKIMGWGLEAEIRRSDGTQIPVELAVGEVMDGGPRMFVGLVHDISERKRGALRQRELVAELEISEVRAREQQRLFRSIFESAPEGIVLTDMEGQILMANPAIGHIFGFEPHSLVGKSIGRLFANVDEWPAIHAAALGSAAPRNVVGPVAIRCVRQDGRTFPAEITKAPYTDASGRRLGSLSTIRDVTWERRREEELRRAQRLEALGQLTGGVAHDFNNLLTVIYGNLQILEMKLQDDRLSRYLVEIGRAVDMGVRLNQRLTTFARQRRLEPKPLDLNQHLTNMLQLLGRAIGEHIEIKTNFVEKVWPTRLDPSEIENAVLNLAINARDAMRGGGKLIIETQNVQLDGDGELQQREELPPGAYVRFSVSDTGVGMPPEVLARAFEPFFTTKAPGKGTGLGLASLYGFVKQSGGHITLCSEVGHGTTVNMYFPKADVDEEGETQSQQEAMASTEGLGETVLVVEDNPDVRCVTVELLKILGYKVLEADNAGAALAIVESGGPIDLVFSDVVMRGGMSGFELAQKLRELRPSQKFLLTSGFTEVAKAGADAIPGLLTLRKPYSQQELSRSIRAALEA